MRRRLAAVLLCAAAVASLCQPAAAGTRSPGPAQFGRTFVATPERGAVQVREPGERRYRRLAGAERLVLGTAVDAERGRVLVTTAQDAAGTQQSTAFSEGAFVVEQRRGSAPLTRFRLIGGDPSICSPGRAGRATAPTARAARRLYDTYRRLKAQSRGTHRRYVVVGRFSTTAVEGTVFTVADRCDGTETSVAEGNVEVIPNDGKVVRGVSLGPGRSAIVYCAPQTPAAPLRTCTLILRPSDPLGAPNVFGFQIGTYALSGEYELCLKPPRSAERCRRYPLGEPLGDGLRMSSVTCITAGAGRYRARWRHAGRLIGPALHVVMPRPDRPLPTIGGLCGFESTATTEVIETTPPWRYGPPVLRP